MFPKRFFMERDTPVRKLLVLSIHVCLSDFVKYGDPLQHGEHIRSPSTEPHEDERPTYSWVPSGTTMVQLYYCYYYRAVYSSLLVQDFASVASVCHKNVCPRHC